MKKIILCLYFILILVCTFIYFSFDSYSIKQNTNINKIIKVDIKGAVKNPGVKKIDFDTTVDELIALSGGLLDDADTSTINLSKRLHDEDVVIIYTKEELHNENYKIIEKECVCPVIMNNACINSSFINTINDKKLISLNSSNIEEIMTLPGIGESKAKAIIEYRNNYMFKQIEDIMNVKGIGKALFEKIKDNITL